MVYGRYIYNRLSLVNGVYKPTYNWENKVLTWLNQGWSTRKHCFINKNTDVNQQSKHKNEEIGWHRDIANGTGAVTSKRSPSERERERVSHLKSGLKDNRTIMFEVRPMWCVSDPDLSGTNHYPGFEAGFIHIVGITAKYCNGCTRQGGQRGDLDANVLTDGWVNILHPFWWYMKLGRKHMYYICGDGDGSELMIPYLKYLGRTFTYQLFF